MRAGGGEAGPRGSYVDPRDARPTLSDGAMANLATASFAEDQAAKTGESARAVRRNAECDENLCGTKLTASEQAMFTAKRKEAYLRKHPETAHGKASPGKDADSASFPSFADDQAAKTGCTAPGF